MKKPIEVVRAKCRFCAADIWRQADDGQPTCDDCHDVELDAYRDSFEVELTLHPITEWRTYGKD